MRYVSILILGALACVGAPLFAQEGGGPIAPPDHRVPPGPPKPKIEPKEEAKDAPVDKDGIPQFEYTKEKHTYVHDTWKYVTWSSDLGIRKNASCGELYKDGKEVPKPDSIMNSLDTPWGPFHYVKESGWTRIPIEMRNKPAPAPAPALPVGDSPPGP